MKTWMASVFAVGLVLIGAAFFAGLYVGQGRTPAVEKVLGLLNKEGDILTAQVSREPFDFRPYWRVWNTLERKFIPHGTSTAAVVKTDDKVYRSIEGLVASYNDPYTVFMRPQYSEDFKMATRGSLEGIGAIIGERDGRLLVVRPLEGSPAARVGIVAGDVIAAVDGESIDGVSVDEAVSRIRGKGGSVVKLQIISEGKESREVSIIRGTIEIPSTAHAVIEREVPVLAVADTGDASDTSKADESADSPAVPNQPVEPETEVRDFYLLRLFSFSKTSINAFKRELVDFVESGSDALIIDLRGNPGGYLDSAVQIAGWFLPQGSVVVREFRGPQKKEIIHTTSGHALFEDNMPKIAILVDKGSASASEILAGALQEYGVATVVGTNTFGKGSVQELVAISDELSLKVTVARWYTPHGVSISQSGLTPDVFVDLSNATSVDPYVDMAVKALSGTI